MTSFATIGNSSNFDASERLELSDNAKLVERRKNLEYSMYHVPTTLFTSYFQPHTLHTPSIHQPLSTTKGLVLR